MTFSSTLSLLKLPDYFSFEFESEIEKRRLIRKSWSPVFCLSSYLSDGRRTVLLDRFFCRKKRGILSVVSPSFVLEKKKKAQSCKVLPTAVLESVLLQIVSERYNNQLK